MPRTFASCLPLGVLAPLHEETNTHTNTIFPQRSRRPSSSFVLLINETGTVGCSREAGV